MSGNLQRQFKFPPSQYITVSDGRLIAPGRLSDVSETSWYPADRNEMFHAKPQNDNNNKSQEGCRSVECGLCGVRPWFVLSHRSAFVPFKKKKSHIQHGIKNLMREEVKKSHSLSLLTSNKVISFQYLALKTIFSYVNLPSFFSDSFGSLKDKAGDFPRPSHCQQISCADPNQQRTDPTHKHCVCLQSPIHLIPLSRRPPLLSKN